MRKTTWLAGSIAMISAFGCGSGANSGDDDVLAPRLGELSADADSRVDVVDRDAELVGAEDYDVAPLGEALDLTSTDRGFRLAIDSAAEVQTLDDNLPRSTYNNLLQAVGMAVNADLITALVVGPPAAAIGITVNGLVVPVGDNVWVATNAVSDGIRTVQGTFVVAWVGVGWLAEMRLNSSDGTYTNTKWFNGFVSADGHVGWWDLYDAYGTLAGVVEWYDDGVGSSEFGIAATSGDNAGDALIYTYAGPDARVSYFDASDAQDYWVHVAEDQSGELRNPAYNGGNPACWDATSADAPCPL